jgi:hypothetical protein
MFENNSIYIIVLIIFVFFILYMIFLLILGIIDKKLTAIKINIPKQDIVINSPVIDNGVHKKTSNNIDYNNYISSNGASNGASTETSTGASYETDKLSNINGYSRNELEPYFLNKPITVVDHEDDNNVCFKNHEHGVNCNYGRTNYPDPNTMNTLDRKIFKTYYQNGLTLQDYISWLYLQEEGGKLNKLPYDHIKYYSELKKGKKLRYIKGICPPRAGANNNNNSAEFYQNLYNDDVEDDIKNKRKINFPNLFNQPNQARSDVDLKMVNDATRIHTKSVTPFNSCNYTSMKNYEELPEMKGKMSARSLHTMLSSKLTTT